MTRRKEINQQAEEYRQPYRDGGYRLSSKDVRDAFEEGAEWADKTMLDKACEWMKGQVYQEYGGGPLERLISDERITDFRKAMED